MGINSNQIGSSIGSKSNTDVVWVLIDSDGVGVVVRDLFVLLCYEY